MNIPALAVAGVFCAMLLVAEYIRPNPKFIRIWQVLVVIALAFGAFVLFFSTNLVTPEMKGIIESVCVPVFIGMILREIAKVALGTFKYKEEFNPLSSSAKINTSPTPHYSGVQKKKKKYKK